MIEPALRKIGLTEGEIKVYSALLDLGSSTTWDITRKSGVSGSKTYEVLDRLISKGLASFVVRNNVKYFEATDASRILDYLDEKERELGQDKLEIQKILPELMLRQKRSPASDVRVFLGWEGLKSANEDIISSLNRGDEWLSMGLTRQPESWEAYFNRRQEARAKKGIIHKHIINEKYRSLFEKRKALPHTEFRFFPREFEMPTSTEIYKDKVIIMILDKESPMAIMMTSEHIATSFRKYFYSMWAGAEKPKTR